MNPDKNRLRRTMMFLNCQKPGLIKDPYIYEPDSIILDLEDAVAANQKDSARYSLYHALKEIDYRGVERVVRINGLDTPYWREDIRVCVAAGADAIRIAKTESAADVKAAEEAVLAAEQEFGRPEGSTLLMAALESAAGVLNALKSAVPPAVYSELRSAEAISRRISKLRLQGQGWNWQEPGSL